MKESPLRKIIKKAIKESLPPGATLSVTGVYPDVKPFYNFQSQGPQPGRIFAPGYNFQSTGPYNFESRGPEGVDYFTEEDDIEDESETTEDDEREQALKEQYWWLNPIYSSKFVL